MKNLKRKRTLDEVVQDIDRDIPEDDSSSIQGLRGPVVKRITRKWLMIYPEDRFKGHWDGLVSFSLLLMCITTPVYIAFHDEPVGESVDDGFNWSMFNTILDFIFAFDILFVFCSSYYNEDF